MKTPFFLPLTLLCAVLPALAVPVSVTVVGPDNQPLPAAKLSSSDVKYARDDATKTQERPQIGDGGVFAFDWDGDLADKRPYGEKRLLRVRIEAPGMAPQLQIIRAAKTTIALQPSRDWSGVVFDQDQKPVAGVTLQLREVTLPVPTSEASEFLSDAVAEVGSQTVVTDANGRWTMQGLPARGNARVTLEDARFVGQRLQMKLGDGDAAPIFVKPGATIAGVLLAPDGKPVAGETVRAGFGVERQVKTDEAGRFVINGIEPGETELYIGDFFAREGKGKPAPAFIFDRVTGVKAEAAQTTDVGAIKAVTGVLLKARVVDAQTKLPLEGARFFDNWGNSTEVLSGADGGLQVRVLPTRLGGESSFSKPKIKSDGYVEYEIAPAKTEIADAVTLDLGTVTLQRGAVVTGTVRLDGDAVKGVRLPSISLSREGKYDFIWPDTAGNFTSKALAAGSYGVNMNGNNGDWQIVSPRNVTVPEAGGAMKPVEVVVKRLTPFLPTIQKANGRIVDASGAGVAGVTVRARMISESGSYSSPTATTDSEGNFTLDGDERTVRVEIGDAQHPSYLISGKAEVEVADGIATVSGLTAKKRGAVFAGRVVGADGQPAAGAWVGVIEARDYAPVQSGADGTFELTDVPLDKFTLIAARGRDAVKQAAQSDKSGVTLPLQTTQSAVDRAAVMQQLLAIKEGVSSDTLFAAWDVLGAEGVEQYMRRNGEPHREIMAMFGAQLARREPATFLARAPQLLEAAQGETREALEAQLNLLRAASDDAGLRTDANAWLDEQKLVKREIKPRSVTQLLQMSAVARKLGREDSAQWLDYAAAIAAQLKGNTESSTFEWRDSLAQLSYEELTRFVEGRSVTDEFQMWSPVARALARAGDINGAQQALARMEILLKTPEMVEFAEQASKNRRAAPAGTVELARSAIAVALAPNDPDATWTMVSNVEDTYRRLRAMTGVANGALQAPGPEGAVVAEKAVRDIMGTRTGNTEFYSYAAAIGARIRPQLGEELFAVALEKSSPDPSRRSGFSPPSIGMWAFYHAPFDAAQSRVLVEREWEWRLPAAIATKNDTFSDDFRALPNLIKAMTAIDLARAAEMQAAVDAIETKSYGRGMTQFGIAVLQLAPPEQRAEFGMDLSIDY